MWTVLAVVATFVLLLIAKASLAMPIRYDGLSLDAIGPFIRSWGLWQERGRIVVRHANSSLEVEFRKRRWKTRPDALVFRVRNADANRAHFEAVQGALTAASVPYKVEFTPHRKALRALEVSLEAEDLHTPAAGCRLVGQSFAALGAVETGFVAHCEGRMRVAPDIPRVPLIPHRKDVALGYRLGRLLGRLRWPRSPLSK
jgi:hypothetical protein